LKQPVKADLTMRVSVFILFSFLAVAMAQEALVEEAVVDVATAETVETEDLDLDALGEAGVLLKDIPMEPAAVEEPELEAEGVSASSASGEQTTTTQATTQEASHEEPEQMGPFIDLLGPYLYSLEPIDETQAQIVPHYTNEILKGKKVVGLYFSADWCGPCRKFTPELVTFYDKMNQRRGHKSDFEIVWVSRCRDMQSYGQYFTHMKWLALPFEEATGKRGQMLSNKYNVKGIPSLVLLDDLGNTITTDARNKIPQDKAGVGFPWQNPVVALLRTVVPRSLRLMVKSQLDAFKGRLVQRLKGLVGMSKTKAA
jgi:nucleoredoxin